MDTFPTMKDFDRVETMEAAYDKNQNRLYDMEDAGASEAEITEFKAALKIQQRFYWNAKSEIEMAMGRLGRRA